VNDPLERFAGLYDQYYRSVLSYALQHADQGRAEDVASEAFLIAWRKLHDVPDPPLPWLLGVARNLLRQHAAATRRQQRLADRIAAVTSAEDMLSWDTGEHVVEREAALELLASLPSRDVETLTLIAWHGLNTSEAAAVVGCSTPAFAVRLHRARRRLADMVRSAGKRQECRALQHTDVTARQVAPLDAQNTSNPRK
jgi:RNA polymerase sigma factor (sigma-70 family)